mmetsp:Transcript_4967/g.10291  ORF Transcript_4967/g.10291 Transcript_4967/m.10291 type:complete len:232 (-) Transcript_4967:507-1202(-)
MKELINKTRKGRDKHLEGSLVALSSDRRQGRCLIATVGHGRFGKFSGDKKGGCGGGWVVGAAILGLLLQLFVLIQNIVPQRLGEGRLSLTRAASNDKEFLALMFAAALPALEQLSLFVVPTVQGGERLKLVQQESIGVSNGKTGGFVFGRCCCCCCGGGGGGRRWRRWLLCLCRAGRSSWSWFRSGHLCSHSRHLGLLFLFDQEGRREGGFVPGQHCRLWCRRRCCSSCYR